MIKNTISMAYDLVLSQDITDQLVILKEINEIIQNCGYDPIFAEDFDKDPGFSQDRVT